jgi:outer membrane protein OmpA-like peptidoglycan-associated protein
MSWITAFGLALLLVSMVILAWVVPNPWAESIEKDAPAPEHPLLLTTLIQENRRRRQLRRRQWILGVGAALLVVAIFIILQAPVTGPTVINYQTSSEPRLSDILVPPSPPPTSISFWYEPVFYIPALLISVLFIAGILLIVRRSAVARVSGASLLVAATLSSQFHLIKDFKLAPSVTFGLSAEQAGGIVDARIAKLKASLIEELTAHVELLIGKIDIKGVVNSEIALKLDLINELRADIKSLLEKIDVNNVKIDVETTINAYLRQYALAPERLGDFAEFDPGKSDFKMEMKATVDDICKKWQKRTERQEGLLIVVGATDRTPLGPSARVRYESNFGLARARAEEIKSKLTPCGSGIDDSRILAIVTGPRSTPEKKDQDETKLGYPKDRMVDVWAIWSWRGSQ